VHGGSHSIKLQREQCTPLLQLAIARLLYDQRQKWGTESGSAQSKFNYSAEYVQPPTIVLFSITHVIHRSISRGDSSSRDLESALP
jgi:hypothetical protein